MPAADERIIKLRTTDCPIEQVVVYADRAEVTRRVTLDALEAGHAVLELRGISTRMDEDSVRVKGSGKATILEVGSELSYDDVDADATGTAAERTALEAELEALEKTLGESDRALSRAARERHLLEGYCAAAIAPPVVAGGGVVATSLDPAAAAKVLDFYAARAVVVDDGEALLAGKRAELDKAEAQLRARLARLRLPSRRQSRLVRVRLDVHDVAEPVALSISYMTHGARWAPSYDARADVQDGAAGALSLQLCYYGLVTNSTGEDWLDAHLALSTAQPASGGQPPALPSLLVGWQHDGAMLMMTKGAARCRAAPAPRCEIANVQCLQVRACAARRPRPRAPPAPVWRARPARLNRTRSPPARRPARPQPSLPPLARRPCRWTWTRTRARRRRRRRWPSPPRRSRRPARTRARRGSRLSTARRSCRTQRRTR
jgi:uncharacterized protein (TIGR02231 family)